MLDLLISGGHVVDGTGAPGSEVDVGVLDGRVEAVGRQLGRAREVVDARGLVVAPGFVDIHTHSDFSLPLRPAGEAKLRQGVTTDVTGNCGFSPFPFVDHDQAAAHGSFLEPELTQRWTTLRAFAADLESSGLGINLAPLVGLGAIRLGVIGEKADKATSNQLTTMCDVLSETLSEGAFGASSGLVYAPSSFADSNELTALGKVLAEANALYATHMRDEGDGLLESVDEAVDVGRRAGCAVQISHLKALGHPNWGGGADALRAIELANEAGVDVWADAYPYTAGSSTLATLLPADELADGEEAFTKTLADPDVRHRIAARLDREPRFPLGEVILAVVPGRTDLSGRRLTEVAHEQGIAASELVLRLLQDGLATSMVAFGMSEDDVRRILSHPRSIVSSDGWTMSIDAAPYAHPRSFAYAVRLLAHYARDEKLLTLEDAVCKLSGLPARRLGLRDRGQVAPGMVADLVAFDFAGLAERATYTTPCVYPSGVEWVWVGGRAAVGAGELTGDRAGRVLLRTP